MKFDCTKSLWYTLDSFEKGGDAFDVICGLLGVYLNYH